MAWIPIKMTAFTVSYENLPNNGKCECTLRLAEKVIPEWIARENITFKVDRFIQNLCKLLYIKLLA